MRDKHTHGPWECDDTHVRTSINSGRKHIAMVNLANNRDYEISLEEHIANARLIAAAPDLLQALEKVMEVVIEEMPSGLKKVCYEAIQKARGEE